MLNAVRRFTITFLVVLLFFLSCQAQTYITGVPVTGTDYPTSFDEQFVKLLKRWRIPGASVAVYRDRGLVLARGYGWADLSTRQPVMPDSLFRIGSVSKAITAVTILKLMEENKINLNDKIFYLLQLPPLTQRRNQQIYQITVRDLLQMSSGWHTDVIDPMFGPWSAHMINQLSNGSMSELPPNCGTAARMMMGIPLQFRPGTHYSYSNINYCLLGLLTNKITGNTYDDYRSYEAHVQQTILAPLGIFNMHIGDTLLQNRAPNEVRYYAYEDITPDPNDLVAKLAHVDGLPYGHSQILKKNFADGGWVASSVDLAKFLQALSNNQILSENTMKIMLAKPAYQKKTHAYFAMGWQVKRLNGHLYWLKTGSFTGTYALLMHRDDGTSYAALFNTKPPQRIIFVKQLQHILNSA